MRGTFITIEGLDFSGKTTLVSHLKKLFGETVCFTREPGGTDAGERIRSLVLDPRVEMDDLTEAYLYAASRADHVRRVILPKLSAGTDIICERYLDSSVAYQGAGRGLGMERVRELNAFATENASPDRTFYLKLDAKERELRAKKRGEPDRLERAGRDFMARVEAAFDGMAESEPERIAVLDATLPADELAGGIADYLRGRAG